MTCMPRIAIAVHDFERTVAMFRNSLGMPVIDFSNDSVASLGAKLAMCVPPGGSNIELMSPADPTAPLSQSLSRFLDQRGEGLFALMLEAPEPDDEAERLIDKGLNVLPLMAGAGGRDIHPRSTHGVLIRVYPNNSFKGTLAPTDDPLALTGIMRVMIAVSDLDAATAVYGDALGLDHDAQQVDHERGVRFVTVRPPGGGVIELVTPIDGSGGIGADVSNFLKDRGEGMFTLILESSSPDVVTSTLASRSIEFTQRPDGTLLDPSQTFGARICIESAED